MHCQHSLQSAARVGQPRPWSNHKFHVASIKSRLEHRSGQRNQHTGRVTIGSIAQVWALASSREEHNQTQAKLFAGAVDRLSSIPKQLLQRLNQIADAAPDLSSTSRVMDVGSGPGTLIPHLQRRGIQDILAVEVTPSMIHAVLKNFPSSNPTVGNELQVRTWLGDVQSIPAYQGLFDAAYFNAVFGNVFDQRDELLRTVLLLKPGGYIVISHPLGRRWLNETLHFKDPVMVPHLLPDQAQLVALIADLPLQIHSYLEEDQLYIATLQVPENYRLERGPVQLHGDVISGFGRGSRQLGFATANLPPKALAMELEGLPKGVYFGWACLQSKEYPEEDTAVHKMVMNIGQNPTVNPANAETTVEIHVLHKYSKDFYGQPMRAIACGFIRPEMKFVSIGALIARIKTDAGIASKQLDAPEFQSLKADAFLSK
ncbi:hypothetical protein WJX77_005068 [Trebouxia sp. C0004]